VKFQGGRYLLLPDKVGEHHGRDYETPHHRKIRPGKGGKAGTLGAAGTLVEAFQIIEPEYIGHCEADCTFGTKGFVAMTFPRSKATSAAAVYPGKGIAGHGRRDPWARGAVRPP